MDPRLIRLYQDELTHLREMGREFAREHPKIAGRLGLEAMEVADPYVERLLEGFAFMAARVQLKLPLNPPACFWGSRRCAVTLPQLLKRPGSTR